MSAVAPFVDEAFAAAAAGRKQGRRLLLAGRPVAWHDSRGVLAGRFAPALAHLPEAPPDVEPSLTVDVLDATAAGVTLPPPAWPPRDFVGAWVRGYDNGPVQIRWHGEATLLQLLDLPGRRALVAALDGSRVPAWHDRAPARLLLRPWAEGEGLAMLHAAVVARGGHAVALAGVSGSGKSSTAAACTLAGLDFLADDACLVSADGRTVWSLYGRAKLEPDAVTRLGAVDPLQPGGTDRGATLLQPPAVPGPARLAAVLLPRVDRGAGGTVVGDPLPPRAALAALGRTVLRENQGVTPAMYAALQRLVAAVPVRPLALGPDPAGVVAAVRGLLPG